MAVDESFKKPGAVPFKWEIRPGVPKVHPGPAKSPHHHQQPPPSSTKTRQFPSPQKLKPPPSSPGRGFFYLPQEPTSRSFLSAPRTRSQCHHHLAQPDIVVSGCFPASPMPMMMLRKKASKKRAEPKTKTTSVQAEPDYGSESEVLSSRWSVSSRNSLSPFSYASPMSTYSSFRSSPRVVSDAEWAGFGLF